MPTVPVDSASPSAVSSRPITPRARRQSWREPAVRVWWLIALVMALAALMLFGQQFYTSAMIHYRASHWRHQVVTIERINYSNFKSKKADPQYIALNISEMSYTDAQGHKHELSGFLIGQTVSRSPGSQIEILLKPSDPTVWSDQLIAVPVKEELIIPSLVLPFAAIFLLIAMIRRRRVLRLYQHGERRNATVVDVQKSAISPRSTIVRVIVPDSEERRLLKLVIPRRIMIPQPDDTLAVITPPGEPKNALAAMLYE